jgi:hypothetical protein
MTEQVQTTIPTIASIAAKMPTKDKPRVRAGTPAKTDTAKAASEAIATASASVQGKIEDTVEGDEFPKTVDPRLIYILSQKRPYASAGEIAFMAWLHAELKRMGMKYQIVAGGNVVVVMSRKDNKTSTVMFSCHTDTVHSDCNGGVQKLCYDASMGHIFLDKDDPLKGSCLGADDGAGVWLMLEMLDKRVPGTYVFHRGEEKGGIGSKAMLDKEEVFLAKHEIAIAFDRKGTDDMITHQGGQECASDKCALAYAARLKEASGGALQYRLSRNGSFTDTRVYRNVIAECFNMSVGYENAHGPEESLDYGHLLTLRDALFKVDFDSLPVDRDPRAAPPAYQGQQYGGYHGTSRGAFGYDPGEVHDDDNFAGWPAGYPRSATVAQQAAKAPAQAPASLKKPVHLKLDPEPGLLDELRTLDMDEMRDICESDPEIALDLVVSLFSELEAAYAKMQTYRSLLGLG